MCFTSGMLKLNNVLPHFDGKKKCLAEALGITPQAVSLWPENEPIPELQEKKLRYEILPGVFDDAA